MSKESTQHKLDRTRKPRVHITYDVEKGDSMEVKELPFVVGVMSDLSGSAERPEKLKDRKFHEVDRDSFNDFLKKQAPRFSASTDDKISGRKDKQIPVDITFESMKDFEPEGIVEKVPVLKELLDIRRRLKSLQRSVGVAGISRYATRSIFTDRERHFDVFAKSDGPAHERMPQLTAGQDDDANGTLHGLRV